MSDFGVYGLTNTLHFVFATVTGTMYPPCSATGSPDLMSMPRAANSASLLMSYRSAGCKACAWTGAAITKAAMRVEINEIFMV